MTLTREDRSTLRRYARDTWKSFEAMAHPSGLPADKLRVSPVGRTETTVTTSPTDIAAYLWAILAAERLDLIGAEEADRRLDLTLSAIELLGRNHGFFLNHYNIRDGSRAAADRLGHEIPPFLSTVDNGWLAASLMMVARARLAFRERVEAILLPMNFRFFFEPFDPDDPKGHPGLLHGGYTIDEGNFTTFYSLVNTEPRIASYVAIARGQIPPEHYYRLFRTMPADRMEQEQSPEGQDRHYLGVKVFEGHYAFRGMKVVPSWGGSMFEALMVPLLVPEALWAPESWGLNHPLYARAQIEQGLVVRRYGAWGFSPAIDPRSGYRTYGVDLLGTKKSSYRTHDPLGGAEPAPKVGPVGHGIITPHASFLALEFVPREAMDNLDLLERRFPGLYGRFGFLDSVDVETGAMADGVLALDQGMILVAIANALDDRSLQKLFCDGPVEAAIRPLIAIERFTASPRP